MPIHAASALSCCTFRSLLTQARADEIPHEVRFISQWVSPCIGAGHVVWHDQAATGPRAAEAADGRAVSAQVRCLAEATGQLLLVGANDLAEEVIERARALAASADELEPHAAALLGWASAHRALHAGDLVAYLRGLEGAIASPRPQSTSTPSASR